MKKVIHGWPSTAAVFLVAALACSEEEPPPAFQAVPVSTRDIVVSASAAGVIEPIRTVEVKSKASGEIMQVAVETGDAVATGDLLVRVDPRVPRNAVVQAEADLDVAQAQLTNAQAQLRRSEALYETASITEQEYEAARLQAANARASLIRAERNLEDARIAYEDTDVRAPSTGIIIEKNVEVGTVISSATREVGGGTVLLRMANLDTVQVRALVDETDIGKIEPGLEVTITVDAYPNRPFRGSVLKIEPQASVQQNVTMFPVLVRIANPQGLLRPGMNAEVEVHVGSRTGVLAVPNAALRTQRDLSSAASVLGIDMETVNQQLAAAREQDATTTGTNGAQGGETGSDNTVTLRGRQIQLPPDIPAEDVREVIRKMRSGGGFQALSPEDRQLMRRVGQVAGAGQDRRSRESSDFLFGGNYIVFVLRDGQPVAVPIETGLTDLDYSEVRSGLSENDTVLVLPSASLVASQREWQERINRVANRGLPGVRNNNSSNSGRNR